MCACAASPAVVACTVAALALLLLPLAARRGGAVRCSVYHRCCRHRCSIAVTDRPGSCDAIPVHVHPGCERAWRSVSSSWTLHRALRCSLYDVTAWDTRSAISFVQRGAVGGKGGAASAGARLVRLSARNVRHVCLWVNFVLTIRDARPQIEAPDFSWTRRHFTAARCMRLLS